MEMPCLEATDYENTLCLQFYGPVPTTPDGRCGGSSASQVLGYPLLWWPEVACLPPCVAPRQCELPSDEEREAAAAAVPTVILTEASQPAGRGDGDWTGWALYEPTYTLANKQHVFVNGALALLRSNTDLLAWAICVAGKMSRLGFTSATGPPPLPADSDRRDPGHYPQHVSDEDIDALADAIVAKVNGQYPWDLDYVYVHKYWEEPLTWEIDLGTGIIEFTQWVPAGQTGAATNVLETVENGGAGVIIPLEHPAWVYYTDQVHNALQSNPPDDAAALCAVTELCTVLIHEWVHRYMDPDMPLAPGRDGAQAGVSDSWSCWAIQKMAANTFRWGIHQRYSCTTTPTGSICPRQGDEIFNWAEWVQ